MKRLVKYLVIIVLGFVVAYLVIQIAQKYSEKMELEARIQMLADANFLSLNGQPVSLLDFNNAIPLVLIYFHPECEHCDYEAQEIGRNNTAFEDCQMVMITPDDSIPRVEHFCNQHNLWELENFEVLLDHNHTFKKTFGKAIIPSVYIYGTDRKLKKRFLGETKPEAIINEIQK